MLRIWAIIAAISIGALLGATPLLDPDEGRNAEVAREMAATNDYVLPHLDGLPYLDKPIVYFAAEAGAMEILGPTELAARLPAYLFTLATAAVIFWFARRLWCVDEACVAAIAYLSMPLTIAFARTVIFDSALTFFMVVAIVAFYFAVETDERKWSVIAWASMGFGVLTKGPVAIAVPLIVAIPYAIWRKRFRRLWSIVGFVLFVAVIAPWVAAVEQSIPDFLRYVLVTETAQRLTTGALKRTGPPWYFIPYVIGGAVPWSIALFRRPRTEDRGPRTAFLWLWVLIPFLFFSISQSKRPQYILPVLPAIALLVAPARDAALILGALSLIGGVVAIMTKRRDVAIVALSVATLTIPIVTTPLMNAIGERRSAKSFVAQLDRYVSPHVHVVGVEAFTGSMMFYLRAPITVASDDGEEFTSNYVIRHYGMFSAAPASALKPTSWLRQTVDGCCATRLYIVRDRDRVNRALFESRGLRPVAVGAHYVAYGPRVGGVNTMR